MAMSYPVKMAPQVNGNVISSQEVKMAPPGHVMLLILTQKDRNDPEKAAIPLLTLLILSFLPIFPIIRFSQFLNEISVL